MAGVNSKPKAQQDLEMTCCLGDHPIDNPKLLPCYHSFCTECVKAKVRPNKRDFTCPKCQLSIPLTEKEVDLLPDNVLFHILQEAGGGNAECAMCKFENKKSPGTFQCLDCGEITCDECKLYHTKSVLTRLHKLVSLKEIKEGKYKSELQAAKQLTCDKHSKQNKPMLMEYYCRECCCLVCQSCAIEEHQPQGHMCKTITVIYDEKITAVNDHVTRCLGVKQLDEEFADILEQSQGQNKELKEKLENEVYQTAAQCIEVIEKVKEVKLEKIRGHFQTEDTSIKATLDDTKNRIIRTDSIVSYTKSFLKHSAKAEFLKYENEMMKKLTNYLQQKYVRTLKTNFIELGGPQIQNVEDIITQAFGEIKMKREELTSSRERDVPRESVKERKVLFTEESSIVDVRCLTVTENNDLVAVGGSTIQVDNSRTEAFGEITIKGNEFRSSRERNVPRKWMREPKVLFSVDSGISKAFGLTVMENEDIVAVGGSTIQMYNSEGTPKERIYCSQLQEAWNVVTKGDTLYVSNYGKDGNVLAMDFKGNVKKTIKLPSTVHQTNGLAISKEGNVYISSCKTNTLYKCEPDETTPKVFIQNPDLRWPRYLSVTPNGEVVVSNGNGNNVQVYDMYGEFLSQYKGQGYNKSFSPRGVCCDKDGYIYIANHDGNNIEVIKGGVLQRRITIKDFNNPYDIALDKDDNIVCSCNEVKRIIKIKVWE